MTIKNHNNEKRHDDKRIDPGMIGRLAGVEAASLAGRAIALASPGSGVSAMHYEAFGEIFSRPELRALAYQAGLVAEGYFKRGLQTMWLCEKMRSAGLLSSDGSGSYKATEKGHALAAQWATEAAIDSVAHAKRQLEAQARKQQDADKPFHGRGHGQGNGNGNGYVPSLLSRLGEIRDGIQQGRIEMPKSNKPKMR